MTEKDFVYAWLLAMRTNYHPFAIEGDITEGIKNARWAYKLIQETFDGSEPELQNPYGGGMSFNMDSIPIKPWDLPENQR